MRINILKNAGLKKWHVAWHFEGKQFGENPIGDYDDLGKAMVAMNDFSKSGSQRVIDLFMDGELYAVHDMIIANMSLDCRRSSPERLFLFTGRLLGRIPTVKIPKINKPIDIEELRKAHGNVGHD